MGKTIGARRYVGWRGEPYGDVRLWWMARKEDFLGGGRARVFCFALFCLVQEVFISHGSYILKGFFAWMEVNMIFGVEVLNYILDRMGSLSYLDKTYNFINTDITFISVSSYFKDFSFHWGTII